MFSIYEIMIAGRYLRSRRTEGFISVIAWFSLIGISLGVATLIIVMSVMNGFRQELLDRVLGMGGHVTVSSATQVEGFATFDNIIGQLKELKHRDIIDIFPVLDGQVMAVSGQHSRGIMLLGMRERDLANYNLIASNLVAGSLDSFEEDATVVLGDRLARALGIGIGDHVTLLSARGPATVLGTVPRSATFRVVALFNIGMFEYDVNIAFTRLEQAQLFFLTQQQVNKIKIFLENPDDTSKFIDSVKTILPPHISIFSWRDTHSHFFSALKVERNVMFLILTMIILVAAFNIISSLIMLVNDKGKSIAIMRTIGATRGMIMRIFLLTGSAIGIVGTLIGVAVGLAFSIHIDLIRKWLEQFSGTELWSPEIRFLSQLPAIVDPTEVIMIVLMSLILSLLATLYPSWKASKVDPVDALRYE